VSRRRLRALVVVEQLRLRSPGGIGTYARGLLQGLGELGDGTPELELLASRPPGRPDPLEALGHPVRASVFPGPVLTRLWDRGVLSAPSGFDVVQAVSLATLETGGTPLVSTVLDLLWRRLPEAYPDRGRAWHEAALHRSLRRAERWIVPADVVAHDLIDAGAPEAGVTVIPLGSDHLPPPDDAAGAALLARLGVDGPFLLSVGTLEPRKNLPRLLDAYRRVRGELPEPWPLVMVGPTGWGEQLPAQDGVVCTGLVAPAELSSLYARARLLAYVPLIEGFGLPPVEAMVVGRLARGRPPRHRRHRRRPAPAGHRRGAPPAAPGGRCGPVGRAAVVGRRPAACRHLGRVGPWLTGGSRAHRTSRTCPTHHRPARPRPSSSRST